VLSLLLSVLPRIAQPRAHSERAKVADQQTTSCYWKPSSFRCSTPSGNVVSREVSVSSEYEILDDAAVASIDKAAPFPPMPKELNRNQIDVSVPFRFSFR